MSSDNKVVQPSKVFQEKSNLPFLGQYDEMYRQSIDNPTVFWSAIAEAELSWSKPWHSVLRYDWKKIGTAVKPYVSWFGGAELNVSYNCLDRHVLNGKKDKPAIIWEGENPEEQRTLSYGELLIEVSRLAQVLVRRGVKHGSTVCMYMPMVPELAIAVLACARIGAIHSVVFSAFSSEALKSRMIDCQANFLITADGGNYAGRLIATKEKSDEALAHCPSVQGVLVLKRSNIAVNMKLGRDYWWHEEIADPNVSDTFEAKPFSSENPLFILYTSGSTGKPKGVLHTSGGYLLHAHTTVKYFFDIKDDDIYWCTADIGWITGHSYLVYGPLSNGATTVMFEGAPLQPDPERTWKIIAKNKVSVFYTAPTAIRSFMKLGDALPQNHNISSLRLLGSVGEPINPEAWRWYYRVVGQERCPVVDTWWQTETGGHMLATMPGAMGSKPGSAGKPFFGVVPKVLKENGQEAKANEDGMLVITKPWPGMLRGVFGDATNALVKNTYFSMFPEVYFTGDGARVDEDGYYWLLGRVDDVLNVSAHRFATAELESALVSHPAVAESAVVGFPHDTKGQGIFCFVTLKTGFDSSADMAKALRDQVRKEIGPIATPDKIKFCDALPKTRSGKIMRRILRKVAEEKSDEIGDTSTLADPSVIHTIVGSLTF